MSKKVELKNKKIASKLIASKIDGEDLYKSAVEELTCFYPSKFAFLKPQRGLRPGEIHVLCGNSGEGKSSLLRALVVEEYLNNVPRLVVTSEEKKRKWALPFLNMRRLDNALKEESNDDTVSVKEISMSSLKKLDNIYFLEEKTNLLEIDDPKIALRLIEESIKLYGIKILYIDNLSTGKFYKLSEGVVTKRQDEWIVGLEAIATKFNIPVVVLMHPKNETSEFHATPEGIAGSAMLRRTMQKCYWIYKRYANIGGKTVRLTILQNMKIRKYTPEEDKMFYLLDFDNGEFTRDVAFSNHDDAMKILQPSKKITSEEVLAALPSFDFLDPNIDKKFKPEDFV